MMMRRCVHHCSAVAGATDGRASAADSVHVCVGACMWSQCSATICARSRCTKGFLDHVCNPLLCAPAYIFIASSSGRGAVACRDMLGDTSIAEVHCSTNFREGRGAASFASVVAHRRLCCAGLCGISFPAGIWVDCYSLGRQPFVYPALAAVQSVNRWVALLFRRQSLGSHRTESSRHASSGRSRCRWLCFSLSTADACQCPHEMARSLA